MARTLYLEDYKKYIEDYLMNKHPDGPSSFKGFLSQEIFDILLLADLFNLDNLKNAFMTKEPRLANPFDKSSGNNLIASMNFRRADKWMKYEIIKNTITTYADVEKKYKLHKKLELEVIYNFMDFLFYEHKVQDNSIPTRKRGWECMSKSSSVGTAKYQTPNRFLARTLKSDVCLIVDGVKLFISPFILKENSLVFKRMLDSTFKEGRKQCIDLPDKDLDDIVQFLNFLKSPQDIKGLFFSIILNLCWIFFCHANVHITLLHL